MIPVTEATEQNIILDKSNLSVSGPTTVAAAETSVAAAVETTASAGGGGATLPPGTYDCTENNDPCVIAGRDPNDQYFPHPVIEKYIQCTVANECFVKECVSGLVYVDPIVVCSYPSRK